MNVDVLDVILTSRTTGSNISSLSKSDSSHKEMNWTTIEKDREEISHEKNVPTKPEKKKPQSRIPGENEKQGRKSGPCSPKKKRQTSPRGVKCTYQGLKRSERLARKTEFDQVYRRGHRLVTRFFIAYILKKDEGPLRLGVVASRKVGNSVLRGRAKRFLRLVFRKNRPEEVVSADLVLIARTSTNAVGYKEIEKEYVKRIYRELEKNYRDNR